MLHHSTGIDDDHVGVAWQPMREVILDGPYAEIVFTDIPQNCRDLLLFGNLRTDVADTGFTEARLQFNGDTGSNYLIPGATTDAIMAAYALDAGTPAGASGVVVSWILDYARTAWRKYTIGLWAMERVSQPLGYGTVPAGLWQSTAAVTDIRIYPAAGNFVADSRIALYGLLGP